MAGAQFNFFVERQFDFIVLKGRFIVPRREQSQFNRASVQGDRVLRAWRLNLR
ncbi:hypothetical protein D9M69_675370 [compost metagenome]